MSEDYKNNQIIRKDAKNCFVESLNDSFPIGKAHLGFASYDMSKPAGSRQTNRINIYISVEELLELCRKLSCGELKYMFQNKKKASDSSPLYQCLGGTSAERLKKAGKSRADGMSFSRTAQIICGSKCDILFVADSGPGEENEKGLIVPRFGNKPENHVAVSMRRGFQHIMLLHLRLNPIPNRDRMWKVRNRSTRLYSVPVYTNDGLKYSRHSLCAEVYA